RCKQFAPAATSQAYPCSSGGVAPQSHPTRSGKRSMANLSTVIHIPDPTRPRAAPPPPALVARSHSHPQCVPLICRLDARPVGISWEVVFVDDNSPDGTTAEVRRIAQLDPRVRCIRRIGRRGLASAVIEGALSSSAAFIAVMDGDLQHDETRLPDML